MENVFPEFSATPFKKFYDLATSAVENDKTNHLDSVTDDGFTEKKVWMSLRYTHNVMLYKVHELG